MRVSRIFFNSPYVSGGNLVGLKHRQSNRLSLMGWPRKISYWIAFLILVIPISTICYTILIFRILLLIKVNLFNCQVRQVIRKYWFQLQIDVMERRTSSESRTFSFIFKTHRTGSSFFSLIRLAFWRNHARGVFQAPLH